MLDSVLEQLEQLSWEIDKLEWVYSRNKLQMVHSPIAHKEGSVFVLHEKVSASQLRQSYLKQCCFA